jgi:hypothetical protein
MPRKGELTRVKINRDWPHQVALPEAATIGASYSVVHDFCKVLSIYPRGYSFRRGDRSFNVFCFAERDHAESFRDRFDGELIDPNERPRWGGSR